MKSFKTVITILMLGFSQVDMKNSPRKVHFESANCSDSLVFNLVGFEQGQNITDKLSSTDQQIFYFPTQTKISMECYAKFPVEIQVEREMPSLVENVRIERHVADILNNESYCYRILFNLPEDYKITGRYTCKGIIHENRTSSIFIFYGKDGGTQLLNSGSVKSIPGLPDDTGWTTIPCIGTNPFKKPVLYRKPEQKNDSVIQVNELTSVARYVPTRGFLVNASWHECCNQVYFCSVTGTIVGTLTIHLLTGFTSNKLHFRVSKLKPGETSSKITLRGPQKISVFCESNEPVKLQSSHQNFSDETCLIEINRKSFYKYRSRLMGTLNAGTLDISCNQKKSNNLIYEWSYTIRAGFQEVKLPGIQLNKNDSEYPFKCYGEANKDVGIYNIQCDDFINCQIAEKFSYLANETTSSTEVFPFSVTSGSKCNTENCAQIHHKPSKKQGIIRCIERNDKRTTYGQRYVYGLSGKIIIEHDDLPNDEEMLRMQFINRTLYLDETITFRCEAASVFFALGIQLVFTLKDKTLLTKSNLTVFNFNEDVRDGKITLVANVTITDFSIEKVSCHAPFWNTEGWKNVSQPLNVEMGQCPAINQDTPSQFVFSLSDVNKIIECEAWGDPKPTITWTKDNDAISNSENKHITEIGNTSRIELYRVKEAHIGTYLCFAQNVRGNASRRFVVKLGWKDHSKDLVIYGSVFGGILVIFTVILFILIKKLRNNKKTINEITELEIREFEHGREDLVRKFAELHENARYLPYKQDFEIPKDKIEFKPDELLGSGAFGIVLKAFLSRSGEKIPVAVKTVRSAGEYTQLRNLLSEIKIMMYIGNHPNIIKFIGALTKELREGKLHVVVEFCGLGNMLSFLRDNRDTFVDQIVENVIDASITKVNKSRSSGVSWKLDDFLPTNERSSLATVKTLTLVRWAYQVASGMEFLGQKKVIHGDLATRNLLLNQLWNVKITDFGLSSHLYDYTNYITKQKEEPVPWRWLAPEAIRDSKFSVATDVWAYGITLWEMFTLAEVPYQGFSWGKEFVSELNKGYRLPSPQYATDEIYTKLARCWEVEPNDRPGFLELKDYFYAILKVHNQLPHEEADWNSLN